MSRSITEKDMMWAAHAACSVTRRCAQLAYADVGRSMLASDLLRFIGRSFSEFEKKYSL